MLIQQDNEEERTRLEQNLLTLCSCILKVSKIACYTFGFSISLQKKFLPLSSAVLKLTQLQVAGLSTPPSSISPSAAEDALCQIEKRISSLETEVQDLTLKVIFFFLNYWNLLKYLWNIEILSKADKIVVTTIFKRVQVPCTILTVPVHFLQCKLFCEKLRLCELRDQSSMQLTRSHSPSSPYLHVCHHDEAVERGWLYALIALSQLMAENSPV